jgi:hypothetical protein
MNFLNPLYLFAALAAVVPLIIHLLHRQRARVEVFPSLEFLRRMMRKRSRRFHLKQILLLLARILILLCLALALAHPTLTGGMAVKGHVPTTGVVILDDSFSMQAQSGGQRLFDIARSKVLDLLTYFDRSDEVYVLTGSRPSRNISASGVTDAERLRERVARLACGNSTTDIVAALREAASIIERSDLPNREIYIVSDMQRPGWRGLDELERVDGSGAKLMLVDVGQDAGNACVSDIVFRLPAATGNLEMEAVFQRFNWESDQGRVAEVFLRDALFDRAVFSPGEAGRERESFGLPPFRGFLWGEIAIAEDVLPIDDRRYFAIPSRRRAVGIVGETYYVETALSPGGDGTFQPVEIDEGGINSENLAAVDVLVLANVPRFSPLEIDAISEYLAGGGALCLFLGDRVDVGSYNRDLLPRLGDLRLEGAALGGEPGFFNIERLDREHGILGKFRTDSEFLSEARFYDFMKVKPGGAAGIAYFSDGSPAVLELNERVIIFTSSADAAWNDFVLTSQFLPLLHETLLYLTSRTRLSQAYLVGDDIVLRIGGGGDEVMLDGPAGVVRHLPEAAGEVASYRLESPMTPGVYFIRTSRETLSVFALNVDTDESDLSKIGVDRIKSGLRGFDVREASGLEDLEESISLLRSGRDLSRAFLWASLILVVFETLLASTLPLGLGSSRDEDALSHS